MARPPAARSTGADTDRPLRRTALEEPLQILAGHSRAGADEMLDQHLPGDVRIRELEAGIGLHHWLVPADPVPVDQSRQQERRHSLGVGRGDEERVGVHLLRLPELADAEAALPHHLSPVDEGEADAGHAELVHRRLDECLEGLDAGRVERMSLAAGEGFPRIAPGPEAADHQTGGGEALLEGGLGPVEHHHRPGVALPVGDGLRDGPLVG